MKTARARSALAVLALTSTAACFDVLAPYEAGGGASAGGAGADIDVPSGGGADEQGGGNITLAEEACDNGVDDDGDGLVDCADTQNCRAATSCGTGCVCGAGVPTESQCDDGADNDRDGRTDCADSDCNARTCATSRLCCASGTCGC